MQTGRIWIQKMIPGFEDFTYEINQDELKAIGFLIPHLKAKKGKKNAVKNARIRQFLKANGHGNFTDVRVRKIINYIRVSRLVKNLVANSKGYFVTSDPAELLRFLNSLQRRENEIKKVRCSYDTDLALF